MNWCYLPSSSIINRCCRPWSINHRWMVIPSSEHPINTGSTGGWASGSSGSSTSSSTAVGQAGSMMGLRKKRWGNGHNSLIISGFLMVLQVIIMIHRVAKKRRKWSQFTVYHDPHVGCPWISHQPWTGRLLNQSPADGSFSNQPMEAHEVKHGFITIGTIN